MFEFTPEFTEKMVEFLEPVVRRRVQEQMQEEIQAEKKNTARAMLSDGMSVAQIERYTNLPANQIEKLRQEMEA